MDFSERAINTELTLRSISFAASMHGGGMGMMGGGMMSDSPMPSGTDYPVLKVRVTKKEQSNTTLPKVLTSITALRVTDAQNAANPKTITLSMRHMSAFLNGRSYKMNDIQPDEIIPVNTLQLIEFDNGFSSGMQGMMMDMPHPLHLHGEQFQIVKREVNAESKENYQTVAPGFINSGWKDVVLVMPGEKVTILKPFSDFKGLFMYHCHNLEHEDMGMMRDFLVK